MNVTIDLTQSYQGKKMAIFSHNDAQESAKEVLLRTSVAKAITEQEFKAIVGVDSVLDLFDCLGEFQGFYYSIDSIVGKCVYASIGNIDFVFKLD